MEDYLFDREGHLFHRKGHLFWEGSQFCYNLLGGRNFDQVYETLILKLSMTVWYKEPSYILYYYEPNGLFVPHFTTVLSDQHPTAYILPLWVVYGRIKKRGSWWCTSFKPGTLTGKETFSNQLLGMSTAKRTSCIKDVHMCLGGGEKAEGLSRLSLQRLSVILFVCSCSS